MRSVKITSETFECIHAINGIIQDNDFLGGDIIFSINGYDEVGYDLFFYNSRDCEGYSLKILPENILNYLENLSFEGF